MIDILVIDIDDLSGFFSGEIQPKEPGKKTNSWIAPCNLGFLQLIMRVAVVSPVLHGPLVPVLLLAMLRVANETCCRAGLGSALTARCCLTWEVC